MVAMVGLAACGSDEPVTAPPSEATPTASASAPDESEAGVVVDIAIADGAVTPRGKRVDVKVGQPVTLRVTSDVDDEIHVHSDPEHEMSVKAGDRDKELTFTLKVPGQVAVESHHAHATIVQLVVKP